LRIILHKLGKIHRSELANLFPKVALGFKPVMAWRFLNYNRYNAFENMAIDKAVFRETIKDKKAGN
jgi:hypothetical protein